MNTWNQLKIMAAVQERALQHPLVLEIMADCADSIDTENQAQYDPEAFKGQPYDGSLWVEGAKMLRERAAEIRKEDPGFWPEKA